MVSILYDLPMKRKKMVSLLYDLFMYRKNGFASV